MEIIKREMEDTVSFEELKPGEVFYDPDDDWYGMVLSVFIESNYNSVALDSGELSYVARKDAVVKVKAHLEVSD